MSTGRRIGKLLRGYFEVPSMTGFSGYRSGGWLVHSVFSAGVAFGTFALVGYLFSPPFWAMALAAFFAVTLSWGIGSALGGGEPGGLFLIALVAAVAAVFFDPAFLLAFVAASVFHGLLSFLLPLLTRRSAAQVASDAFDQAAEQIAEAAGDGRKSLSLTDLGLDRLPPALGELTRLRELDITGNQLTELPRSIANLRGLRKLVAGQNPNLRAIPEWIGELKDLEVIEIHNCALESVPAQLGNLGKLYKLRLVNNRIRSLPPELGRAASLIELDLRGNPIDADQVRPIQAALPVARIQISEKSGIRS